MSQSHEAFYICQMLWMPILQLERKGNVKNIANPIKKGKTKWQVVHKIIQKELDKYEGTSEGSQKNRIKDFY